MEGQQPHILRDIWFTGLNCSGMTMLAFTPKLPTSEITRTFHLYGYQLRLSINFGLGLSQTDRDEKLFSAAHSVGLFPDEGYWVLSSFTIQKVQGRQLGLTGVRPQQMSTVIPFYRTTLQSLVLPTKSRHFRYTI